MTGSAPPPHALVGDDARILGIETSCDETAVGVVQGGRTLLSNVIGSQSDLHSKFGGVVPEIAARAHLEQLPAVVARALRDAGMTLRDVDGVAATRGPGLIGALVVGFAAGKAMASSLGVPFAAVHHLEGHIFAAVLEHDVAPPFVALVVSGGHTHLYRVDAWGSYELLGRTLDDAAGEAFDKVARFLGLGFPGGPAIDRLSRRGNPEAVAFPRAMLDRGLDFSFSGLKTAVVRHVQRTERHGGKIVRADVAASFQEAVVDVQVAKTVAAAELADVETVVVGGGVAANSRLRALLEQALSAAGRRLVVPSPSLCVDNGAMIAAAGQFRLARGDAAAADDGADPSLPLQPETSQSQA